LTSISYCDYIWVICAVYALLVVGFAAALGFLQFYHGQADFRKSFFIVVF